MPDTTTTHPVRLIVRSGGIHNLARLFSYFFDSDSEEFAVAYDRSMGFTVANGPAITADRPDLPWVIYIGPELAAKAIQSFFDGLSVEQKRRMSGTDRNARDLDGWRAHNLTIIGTTTWEDISTLQIVPDRSN